MKSNDAETKIYRFYNTVGWETQDGITEDAKRFEDLREVAREYVSKCRNRVLRHIPEKGEYFLDMGSGPIQYKEYLEYSKNYTKRYCIDLSSKALEDAEKKIGDHGFFFAGSLFDIRLEEDFFDCTISLHTIYHIDRDKQDEAIRKLVAVTKPGKPVIIVYWNPRNLIGVLTLPIRLVRKTRNRLGKADRTNAKEAEGYCFAHPISWWNRFKDIADIEIMPWRSFVTGHQKILIPNNKIGKKMFDILFKAEEMFPNLFAKYFDYPMIILTKK